MMNAEEIKTAIDVGPFLAILGQVIGWTFFLIALAMFKNFISHGFSMAIGEFLLKINDNDLRERLCKWFGNSDVILDHLKEMDKKLAKSETP
jgi:hypothetical protein